ncbi:hypothetical protein HK102_010826, partial [Quaeritorhiza haematococci]
PARGDRPARQRPPRLQRPRRRHRLSDRGRLLRPHRPGPPQHRHPARRDLRAADEPRRRPLRRPVRRRHVRRGVLRNRPRDDRPRRARRHPQGEPVRRVHRRRDRLAQGAPRRLEGRLEQDRGQVPEGPRLPPLLVQQEREGAVQVQHRRQDQRRLHRHGAPVRRRRPGEDHRRLHPMRPGLGLQPLERRRDPLHRDRRGEAPREVHQRPRRADQVQLHRLRLPGRPRRLRRPRGAGRGEGRRPGGEVGRRRRDVPGSPPRRRTRSGRRTSDAAYLADHPPPRHARRPRARRRSEADRPADRGGRRVREGRVALARRDARPRRGQEPGRLAQQDLQLRAPRNGRGLRRLEVGGDRPRDAEGPAVDGPDLLLLVSREGHAAAGRRGEVGLLPDDRGRLRRGLGRRQAAVQGGPGRRQRRGGLQPPQPRRAGRPGGGQDLLAGRLRHQRPDLRPPHQLDLPRPHVPGDRGQGGKM